LPEVFASAADADVVGRFTAFVFERLLLLPLKSEKDILSCCIFIGVVVVAVVDYWGCTRTQKDAMNGMVRLLTGKIL
jgi:hypothetical protein